MYKVIGNPQTRAFRLMWMLEELGQDYTLLPMNPHSDALRAINPSGKVPVLYDDKLAIRDSVAGCIYLAEKHGVMTATPGTPTKARLDSLLFLILDEIEGPLWTKAKHSFALPEKLRVASMKDVAIAEYRRGLANLAARLGNGPYLMGNDFSYVDLILGHCAAWAERAGMPAPENEELAALLAMILARPARAATEARRQEILTELATRKDDSQ